MKDDARRTVVASAAVDSLTRQGVKVGGHFSLSDLGGDILDAVKRTRARCSEECPDHDGKRCRVLGYRAPTDFLCEA